MSSRSIKLLSEFYQLHVYCLRKESSRWWNKAVGYQHAGKENDSLPSWKAKAPQVRPVCQTSDSFHLSLSDKFSNLAQMWVRYRSPFIRSNPESRSQWCLLVTCSALLYGWVIKRVQQPSSLGHLGIFSSHLSQSFLHCLARYCTMCNMEEMARIQR